MFSNTSLLKKVKEETSSKRKPKEILILISRMIAVLLTVLAFAQPTIRNGDQLGDTAENVIVYLDNAPALQNTVEGESSFNMAVKYAQSILNAYPEGTKFHFLENSYQNSILTNYTKESLSERLAETEVVSVGRELGEIIDRIEASNLRGDVYLISDFNKLSEELILDSLNHYYLSPVLNNLQDDLFIDTVYLENAFLSGDFSNRLNIKASANNNDVNNTNVRVYFGDNLSGTINVDIEGTGEALFEIPEGQSNLDQVRLEIEDPSVEFDNSFYLSINSLQLTNVVEVFDQSSSDYISQLFDENEYFNFQRTSSSALENQLLSSADIIVVNGVSQYSNQLKNELKSALAAGVNVTIIPSMNFSSAQLLDIGIRMVSDDQQEIQLQSPDFSNPFFEGVFEEQNVNMQMPFATTDYRLLNAEYDLLTYLNGRSFFSKVATNSNLFVFTTPFQSQKTSFINHALFVPVFYRLALGSKRNFANLYYYTDGEVVTFPLSQTNSNTVYNLSGNEVNIIPDQRVANSQLIMSFPKDEIVAGNFQVKSGDEPIGFISFNQSKKESRFSESKNEILQNLAEMNYVTLLASESANSFGNTLEANLIGQALWKWALALGLFFLFVEIILIRYL